MSNTKKQSKLSPRFYTFLSWFATLLLPVVLVLTGVRLLLTTAFVKIEYNTPAFPADPYGFTKEERIYWASISLDYLLNGEDISFLADLRFPEGQQVPPASCRYMDDCSRFYNDSELGHMQDVKEVVGIAMNVWYASLVILVLLAIWAWLGAWVPYFRRGLARGGWLTAILIGSLVIFVLISFGILFVAFHEVFFDPGTWRFLYSDSLIRLFPERFWRDTFLAVGLFAGGLGLLIGFLLRDRKTK